MFAQAQSSVPISGPTQQNTTAYVAGLLAKAITFECKYCKSNIICTNDVPENILITIKRTPGSKMKRRFMILPILLM